jgi:hypothetical protein
MSKGNISSLLDNSNEMEFNTHGKGTKCSKEYAL